MLVLSRKKRQSIVIDGNIVVTLIEIQGDRAQLGIEAPRHVPVHRREVHEAIRTADARQKRSAPTEDGCLVHNF